MNATFSFDDFFRACTGRNPFPWQTQAAQRMKDGKPMKIVAVPTGLGKTGLVIAWIWGLAHSRPGKGRGVPLRYVHVSPRRVIVDQTGAAIDRIAKILSNPAEAPDPQAEQAAAWVAHQLAAFTEGGGPPLVSARLRGGVRPEPAWRGRIDQPVAVAATSDLAGSGLLFRHWTSSASAWPVVAGLLGADACWVLDEAHLQTPLLATLERCRQAEAVSPLRLPWWLIQTTATPRSGEDVLGLSDDDRNHPVVKERLKVCRHIHLHGPMPDRQIAGQLAALAHSAVKGRGARAVLIVTDTVRRARDVFTELGKLDKDAFAAERVWLLHGQQREQDRLGVLQRVESAFSMERPPSQEGPASYLVATNAIEVGADLSADHLVTTACPADSLLQRLGRLGRRADAVGYHCDLVVIQPPTKKNTTSESLRDRYNSATDATVKRLREHANGREGGVSLPAEGNILTDPGCASPAVPPMPLSPTDLRALLRTRPPSADSPDVDALIHGIEDPDDTAYLAWRDDLRVDDQDHWVTLLESWPLRPHETLPLPASTLQAWLLNKGGEPRPFLLWEEGKRARLVKPRDEKQVRIHPGLVVVVPSAYGGHDGYGFCPDANAPVPDLADLVTEHPKGPRLRLRNEHLPEDLRTALQGVIAQVEDPDVAERDITGQLVTLLQQVANNQVVDEVTREAAKGLHAGDVEWELRAEGVAISLKRRSLEDDDEHSLTKQVGLQEHQEEVANLAAGMATRAGVPDEYVTVARLAGLLHDAGKAEERFQAALRGGHPRPPAEPHLAKSGLPRRRWQQAASQAGVPSGFRHEALSAALAATLPHELVGRYQLCTTLVEVLTHLIGASHGWGRPWFPPIPPEPATGPVQATLDNQSWSVAGNPRQQDVPQGTAARFERLNAKLGPWSLAWLEATVRLADQTASAK